MDFVDLYQEFESLERRVKVQSLHIQQVKLEAYEGGFQSEEQLMQEHHSQASHAPASQPTHYLHSKRAFKEERRQSSHILNLI
jgi:hypothetical protein